MKTLPSHFAASLLVLILLSACQRPVPEGVDPVVFDSTLIYSAQHDEETGTLTLNFTRPERPRGTIATDVHREHIERSYMERQYVDEDREGIHAYYDVPREVFEGLVRAGSKGRYYHVNIRDRYESKPIED